MSPEAPPPPPCLTYMAWRGREGSNRCWWVLLFKATRLNCALEKRCRFQVFILWVYKNSIISKPQEPEPHLAKGNKAGVLRKESIRSFENRQPHLDLMRWKIKNAGGFLSMPVMWWKQWLRKMKCKQDKLRGGAGIREEAVIWAQGGGESKRKSRPFRKGIHHSM